jgi:EAL and modified HD-GYP domain-containing signal transduction protein
MRPPWTNARADRAAGGPAPAPAGVGRVHPEAGAVSPAPQPIYVARQPVLDRASQVVGYELLFRGGPENRFDARDVDRASAVNIEQSTAAFGLDTLVGERIAFVNLSRGALLDGFYRLLPRERTVVELLESVTPDTRVIAACQRLKAEGYRLALDDFTNAPASRPLLAVADMVKMDLRQAAERFDPHVLQRLRDRGIHLLAEKVETPQEHHDAVAAGYDLFQGYYYCHPEMVATRDLPPSKLTALRFLAEVSREDASFDRLEELFLQDVALTLRLLRYLNSAAFGWRHEVTSVRHALALMGLRPLRKWAMMMGLLTLSDDRPRELTVTALSRARFAERIGPASGVREHEFELFLTGMLSVADAMIGRPIREILSALSVPRVVREALLEGRDAVGAVLRLVTAWERGDWATVESVRRDRGVDPGDLRETYLQSLAWAEATAGH